jgi:hypothetical protein
MELLRVGCRFGDGVTALATLGIDLALGLSPLMHQNQQVTINHEVFAGGTLLIPAVLLEKFL